MKKDLKILQVNDYDIAGGAEVIATNLFYGYLNRGYHSYLFVGTKRGSDSRINEIEMGVSNNLWERLWLSSAGIFKRTKDESKVSWMLFYCAKFFAHPLDTINLLSGIQDYNYPAIRNILNTVSEKPDILHFHNLHENYFDLSSLPLLSNQVPVVLTLHDLWLLNLYNDISELDFENFKKTNTSLRNICTQTKRKLLLNDYCKIKKIFEQSQLYVTTPSKWILDLAYKSILKPAITDSCVIPNGVDLTIFRPYDKIAARKELEIPLNYKVLVFIANGIRKNTNKDFNTLQTAISVIAKNNNKNKIILLAIGENNPDERIGNIEIKFFPFIQNPRKVARYYQAADLYVHSSHTESWGLTITESLACGIPVVATKVGGIPEQITDGFNGFLTEPGNSLDMAEKINLLLNDEEISMKMRENALNDAKLRFDINLQIERYLTWYDHILEI